MIKRRYANYRSIYLLFAGLFLLISHSFSQVIAPMSVRYQTNAKGSITIISNVSISCNSGNNCNTARAEVPPAGTWGNHSLTMAYVDSDADPTTYMSSSDSLILPNCSEVLWAGLYWGARIAANTTNYNNRTSVKLKLNSGAYQTMNADQTLDVPTINGQSWTQPSYYCFKNITNIVSGAGLNARFTIADLVSQGGSGRFGGWSIVVVYKNVLQSMRNLTVFDGLANVGQNSTLNIPFSGFITPPTGPVSFELGLIAHDGDRDLQGDYLQFNGVTVSDALHSATNFFNSSITDNAVLTPFRNPSYNNTLGYDANLISPNNSALNYLGNNATSATLTIGTNQDVIIPRVITSAIDIYEPDLRATVYVQDLNGGQVLPGDILEYTMVGKNIGSDVSDSTYMVDTLDLRMSYIPGSISYLNGVVAGAKTDVSGDDQAEYDAINHLIRARVGTGANGLIGGSMSNSPNGSDSTAVRFRVQVLNDCLLLNCDSTIGNKAYIFGVGNISGNLNTNNGVSDFYDANGCPTSNNNELTIHSNCPPPNVTHNDPLCLGDSLQFAIPFSPFANYSWVGPSGFSSTSPAPVISPVAANNAGVYQLNITFNGSTCTFFNLLDTVVVLPNPTINLLNLTNVTCFNAGNGSISVQGNSTPSYSYLWNTSSSSSAINSLIPGQYTVTVTDGNTCQSTASYQITQPTLLIANATVTSNYNGQQISCFNASDGTASVVASGGTAPYTYLWSNGQSTSNATGLDIGFYSVIVTDANGCQAFDTIFLSEPTPIVLATTHTNVTCFGGFNGSINLTASGGTFPYTFAWSNNTNNQNAINLPAGIFTVTVTDINGCTQAISDTVLQPAQPITPSETHINVGCYGDATGSIDLSVVGGTPGYTYSWNIGSTTQDLSNLPFGVYTVFITDANNCIGQFSVVVNQPAAPLSNSAVITPVACFADSSGAINMGVSGGTPPYSYVWSNGPTTGIISGLPTGNYSVNVLDANGCPLSGSYFVNQPLSAISVSATHADIFCFGAATGSIDLTPAGGTLPYSYLWNTNQVSQDLNNIPAGTYSVVVQDANGCTDSISQTLINLSLPIVLSETHQDVLCNGFATGTIDLSVSGGTPAYSYSWSTAASTQDVSGLTAGTYSVVVTDANFCTDTLVATIGQPANALVITETHINPSCIGGTSGSIDLSVSGGVPGYTYQWDNGETTQDIDTLFAGTYTVLVLDSNGCQIPFSVALLDPSNGMALSHTFGNVNCFGGADGFIDLNVVGGNPNYYYQWSNGSVMQDIANLTPGSYFVNVTDVIGCGLFLSQVITQPDSALNVISSFNNIPCYGDSSGSVTLTVSGGTQPYSFLWNTGATQQNLFNLPVGTYSVTVSDANGCTQYLIDSLSQPPGALTSSYLQTHVTCFGTSTGAVDLSVFGGVAPYSFAWTNGASTEDLNGVPAGAYTVTITDAAGCTDTHTVYITQPANALSLAFANTNVSCFGGNNGSINLTPSFGTAPYTYAWSNGATTQDLNNLFPGSYSVVVTDLNGCTASINALITQPANPLASTLQHTNVTCHNGASGTATAAGLGGTPPYAYTWSNGQTTSFIDSLIAGIYSVVISDANGCTSNQAFAITQPAPLIIQSNNVNNLCYGQTSGSIALNVIGGVLPYSYLWNTGATQDSIGALAAGPYFVTVTDDNGCTATHSDTITQPPSSIALNVLITDNLCFGYATGAIDLTSFGGSAPYQYQWNNGATSQDLQNLTAGTYTIAVIDINGCLITDTFTVNQPPQSAVVTPVIANVSCFGGSNGAVQITVVGPNPPFSYAWSNGATTEDIFNLVPGAYTNTITDAVGCVTSYTANVTQPAAPLSMVSVDTDVLCFAQNTGSIDLSVFGGVAPYTYVWNNSASTQDIQSLAAGIYSVLITDANGCQAPFSTQITQPPAPITSFVATTNVLCFGQSTGAIDLTVSGGTAPYLYNWSNGFTSQDINALPIGFYSVLVTDANGCTHNASANIYQPAAPVNVSTVLTPVSCFNFSDGSIAVTISGGTPSYFLSWSNGATTNTINNLSAGFYALQVTDFNGCTSQWNYNLTQPAGPLLLSTTTGATGCFNGNNGIVDLTVVGGTAPYSYNWSNGFTTQDINSLTAGYYSVLVTDANGCTAFIGDTVLQPLAFTSSATLQNINCFAQSTGAIDLSVTGGTAPYSYLWNNGAPTQDLSNLLAGTYSVTITDANNCAITNSFVLSQPLIPTTLSLQLTSPSCFGSSDGSIDLTVVSGNASLSYLWSNNQSTQDLNNIPAGTYLVTVTDNLGCIDTISAFLTQPNTLAVSAILTNPTCVSANNGVIDLTITGGTAPYSFVWLSGQTTEDLANLTQGTYFVSITDTNGCATTASFTLTDPSPIVASYTFTPPTCFGGTNATIDVTVSGGLSPYSYTWASGPASQDLVNVGAGNDTLYIVDANNCPFAIATSVTQPDSLQLNFNVTNIACFGNQSGAIDLSVLGGTPSYTYLWSNNITSQDLNNLNIGWYNVLVTDNQGCQGYDSVQITQPAAPITLLITGTNITCFGLNDGSINLTPQGGTAPYLFTWSNGSTTEDLSGLSSGNYIVTVTDANGCQATTSIYLSTPAAALLISNAVLNNVQCFNQSTGSIDLTITGGSFPYFYTWTNPLGTFNASTQDLFNIPAGGYSVVVTDFNGCSVSANYTISQPPSGAVISSNVQPVFCFGDSTGWINATVIGGALPYAFTWSNGVNAEDLYNIPAGTYVLTVTDNIGCVTTASILVAQPSGPLFSNAIVSNQSCFGVIDASIDANLIGGTAPYYISWSTGETTALIDTLVIGQYDLHVVDSLGCVLDTTFFITQPNPLLIPGSVVNVACHGDSSAYITALPNGGTAPYSYSWSNGQTTQVDTLIPTGAYVVTVTDANGCVDSALFNVTQPASPITLTTLATNVGCFGASSGFIDLSVAGGTPGYTYSWSNNAITQDIQNLPIGTYTATVTDANGCVDSIQVNLTQPAAPLIALPNITNAPCFGQNGGSIDLNVTGGTAPYSYFWNTGDTTQDLSAVPAGQYTVVVSDANNCATTLIINITQPQSPINVTLTSTQPSCFGYSDGALSAVINGGIAPYSYLWSTGATTPSITNLTAQQYLLTVTDANGCSVQNTFGLAQPDSLVALFNIPDNFGCAPFQAQLINQSIGQYTNVLWTFGNGDVVFSPDTAYYSFNQLGCFDVTLTVTSANGCVASNTANSAICVVAGPVASFYATTPQIDFFSGQVQYVNNSYGIGNDYFWQFGDGSQSTQVNPAHTYPPQNIADYDVMLVAVDTNGCVDTAFQIYQQREIMRLNVPNSFTPGDDGINDNFKPIFSAPDLIKYYEFDIYNRWGELIFSTKNQYDAWDGKYNGVPCQSGAYTWKIKYTDYQNTTKDAHGHVVLLW